MADILIQDVPDEVLAAIDATATSLGLSRTEYLRRALARERRAHGPVTVSVLTSFSEHFSDLLVPALMERASQ
jgi:indole-3-glycerol phosphate synthase